MVAASRTPRSLALRTQIVLRSTEGETAAEVAESLGVSTVTVQKWRSRISARWPERLGGLASSWPTDQAEASVTKRVMDLTTKRIPKEATHWSTRLMAKYAGVSQWQVRQVWEHRLRTFKISNDPHFSERVIDVVGLYLNPPDGNGRALGG